MNTMTSRAANALEAAAAEELRAQRWSAAIAMLEGDLSQVSRHWGLAWQLGWAHLKLLETDDAIQWLRESAKLAPAEPYPHWALGEAYSDARRVGDAELEYLRSLVLKDGSLPRSTLIRLCLRQRREVEALAIAREGVRVGSGKQRRKRMHEALDGKVLRRARASSHEADALRRSIRGMLSRRSWKSVVATLGPKVAVVRNDPLLSRAMGWSCLMQRRVRPAMRWANNAVRLAPEDSKSRWVLGEVFVAARRSGDAELEFLRSIALRDARVPRNSLACLLESLGRRKEATAVYLEGLRLAPAADRYSDYATFLEMIGNREEGGRQRDAATQAQGGCDAWPKFLAPIGAAMRRAAF